jgi:hypothetical protein
MALVFCCGLMRFAYKSIDAEQTPWKLEFKVFCFTLIMFTISHLCVAYIFFVTGYAPLLRIGECRLTHPKTGVQRVVEESLSSWRTHFS